MNVPMFVSSEKNVAQKGSVRLINAF